MSKHCRSTQLKRIQSFPRMFSLSPLLSLTHHTHTLSLSLYLSLSLSLSLDPYVINEWPLKVATDVNAVLRSVCVCVCSSLLWVSCSFVWLISIQRHVYMHRVMKWHMPKFEATSHVDKESPCYRGREFLTLSVAYRSWHQNNTTQQPEQPWLPGSVSNTIYHLTPWLR